MRKQQLNFDYSSACSCYYPETDPSSSQVSFRSYTKQCCPTFNLENVSLASQNNKLSEKVVTNRNSYTAEPMRARCTRILRVLLTRRNMLILQLRAGHASLGFCDAYACHGIGFETIRASTRTALPTHANSHAKLYPPLLGLVRLCIGPDDLGRHLRCNRVSYR